MGDLLGGSFDPDPYDAIAKTYEVFKFTLDEAIWPLLPKLVDHQELISLIGPAVNAFTNLYEALMMQLVEFEASNPKVQP